jgi:hypothetical protein
MDINSTLEIILLILVVLFVTKQFGFVTNKTTNNDEYENFEENTKKCILDDMESKLYNFATNKNCRNKDCDSCEFKFNDEQDVIQKVSNMKNENAKCIVDKMENEVKKYMTKMIYL